MYRAITLRVQDGTIHTVPMDHLGRLQELVGELGEATYPLVLRLGAMARLDMQPVTARALLAEVEKFLPLIGGHNLAGVLFCSVDGSELGGYYGGIGETLIAEAEDCRLSVTAEGIRLAVRQFPPPVGFRSHPEMATGWYECYFASLDHSPQGTTGVRMPSMGGSGAPVQLTLVPALPPVTRWHYAHVAGQPVVAATRMTSAPAKDVFRDVIHAITAACTEALRLHRPLRIVRE